MSRRGFSLLEMVIVLAITGGILALSAGSFLSLAPKYRLESAVWETRAALNRARVQALRDGVSYRVRFPAAGITTERYDPERKAWILWRRTVPEGVLVTANNAPVFTALGSVTGLATITAANAWGSYKLTVAITGRVKTARIP
ncbi:MAG: prepilin-type N-terminal cleavage/methylation domain-containing protein [Acidobacteriota bacterium]|nr:prepilin-type N-terminal cleavage/methylation domain-containing protein [Acidobacteriota bacterium]